MTYDDEGAPITALVVGSLNSDHVLRVPALPVEGETLSARSAALLPGGKGANQAVALARLGCAVRMAGSVGDDDGGRLLLRALADAGVDTSDVRRTAEPTGTAIVMVSDAGDNAIVVHAGANGLAPDVTLAPVDLAVLQLELPVAVVEDVVHRVRPAARRIVLNAAPPARIDPEVLALVDVLVVNEHEAAEMAGAADPRPALEVLRPLVRELAVVTLGADGGMLLGDRPHAWSAAHAPEVVDTTGAGDCFVAALSRALAVGAAPDAAAAWAATASALAVGREGAQAGMPSLDDLPALDVVR